MKLITLINSDYRKHRKYGGNFFSIVLLTQGFWATFQYRFAHTVYKMKIPILKQILQFICLLWQKGVEIFTGISIPASASIGHSFYIGHFGGIILNAKVKLGNNCNISQGVSIAVSGRGDKRGVPIIKDNVYIGANAVVAGKIVVGSNSVIGANSLVVGNVDESTTVLGVPAIKINDNNSKGYI